MNWFAIAGGAALLVIYLAGKRVAKGFKDEPPVWGDHGGGGGNDGYYGGGGGGDGGGGLSLISPVVAPIGSDIAPKQTGALTIGEAFISDIGFVPKEGGDEKSQDDRPLVKTVPTTIDIPPMGTPKSASVPAQKKSAMAIETSAMAISTKAEPQKAAAVTSRAVQTQPIRTLAKVAPTVSAIVTKSVVGDGIARANVSPAQPRSTKISSMIASATPLASSTLSGSAAVATRDNAKVTSQAVEAQPVRTLSPQVAAVSAKTVTPTVVAKPIAMEPVIQKPVSVSTSTAFINAIRPKSISVRPAAISTQRLSVVR